MKGSISKKDIKLLLYVGGILLLVIAYFLGYQKFMEKRQVLEAEQSSLLQQVSRLNEIYEGRDTYEAESAEFQAQTAQILTNYPAEVREEDAILFACDMEDSYSVWVKKIGLSMDNVVYSLGGMPTESETSDTDTTEDGTEADAASQETSSLSMDEQLGIMDESTVQLPSLSLINTSVSYDFETGYTDCKSVFAMILDYAEKRNVPSISLKYNDQTGLLDGNMNVSMFYVSGTDKLYMEPDAGVILHGKENLFGTVENQED